MSAKKAYEKPPVHLPLIPTELWIQILRTATSVPDSLDNPELLENPRHPKAFMLSNFAVKRYKASLVTKRYVVLVCRAWHTWATPFLYEHVTLKHFDHLAPLVDTMSHIILDDTRTLGSLTKRLDILPKDTIVPPDDEGFSQTRSGDFVRESAVIQALRSLFSFTPNLTVLVVNGFMRELFNMGNGPLEAAAGAIPQGLQRLKWALTYSEAPSEQKLGYWPLSFMSTHPAMVYMDLISLDLTFAQPAPTTDQSRPWPAMREIAADLGLISSSRHRDMFPAGAFPNLERAYIGFRDTLPEFQAFLERHSTPLRSLRLSCFHRLDASVNQVLSLIKGHCPGLEELAFECLPQYHSPGSPKFEKPPVIDGIRLLSIATSKQQLSKKECTLLLEDILAWVQCDAFPNVRSLRLFLEANVVHLQTKHPRLFNGFLAECSSVGVLVEDHFGCPLRPSAESVQRNVSQDAIRDSSKWTFGEEWKETLEDAI